MFTSSNTRIYTKNHGILKIPYIPGIKFSDRLKNELNSFKLLGLI